MRVTRIERAITEYNEKVATAKPTENYSLPEIKREILSDIYYEIFQEEPNKEEQKWLDKEVAQVMCYLNTETF